MYYFSLSVVLSCWAALLIYPVCISGMGCYVCESINGSNPACEDPFNTTHPNSTGNDDFFNPDCFTGRKNRNGLFPSTACVKVKGRHAETGATLMMRTCTVDSNSLTTDTELIRIPDSCGLFDFETSLGSNSEQAQAEDELNVWRMHGCISVCEDADGCNGSTRASSIRPVLLVTCLLQLLIRS